MTQSTLEKTYLSKFALFAHLIIHQAHKSVLPDGPLCGQKTQIWQLLKAAGHQKLHLATFRKCGHFWQLCQVFGHLQKKLATLEKMRPFLAIFRTFLTQNALFAPTSRYEI